MRNSSIEHRVIVLVLMFTFGALPAFSTPPGLINYQGRLTEPTGNPVPDSAYIVHFSLYGDSTSSIPVFWQEQHLVTTIKGLFNVTLGTENPLDYSVLLSLPSMWTVYLGIRVGTEPEMIPRIHLTSVLFAQDASHAHSVTTINQASGGSITSSVKISDSLGIGLGQFPPSERLDVGGNAKVSGMISVQSNAGSTVKPQIGDRWRDNSIVAWGNIGPNAEIIASFGIDSVQHVSTGHYMVFLSNTFVPSANNMVVFAQAYSTIENHMLTSVRPITGSTVEVGMKLFNTNSLFDSQFVVLVTGR